MKDLFRPKNVIWVNTQHNISTNDDVINVDTSVGACQLVLPYIRGAGLFGEPKRFYINDVAGNASTNNITLVSINGDLINNGSTLVLKTNGVSVEVLITNINEYLANQSGTSGGVGGNGAIVFITASGTNNYIANGVLGIVTLADLANKLLIILIPNANTADNATININSTGVLNLVVFGNSPTRAGDFKNGQYIMGAYDGGNFQVMSVTDNIAV